MPANMPMTPGNIPPTDFPDTDRPKNTARRPATNPLRFKPIGGFLFFLQLPCIIITGMAIAYFVGRFHFSFIFLLPVAHVVYYILRRRSSAYARTIETLSRDKSRREALGEFESVEWINYILRKFWEVSEAGISSQIYSMVNAELKKNKPSFLKSLRLTELTLGTRPPVIERIGFMEKNEDIITIESAFNFIPVEASEDVLYYFGEERQHWNTCIELTAKVGFVSIPLLVRNFTFSGIIRMQLGLTRRIPFLKSASISMLELPIVDFQILPLRAADLMDLVYLSGFIHRLIDSSITKLLLFPKSIDIDLQSIADYRGTVIGVVFVHVHALESVEQQSVSVSLSVNGCEFARTAQQSGRDPLFNEGFYTIVQDTTRSVNVVLHSGSEKLSGRILLRNLNKHIWAEYVHLSSESSRRFLNVATSFFPLTGLRTNSAIISMTLVSVRDLQAKNHPKNRLYTTYALITLESKDSIRVRRVLQTFESKRIFSTKDPFYNEIISFFVRSFADYILKIKIMDDKNDSVIGSVILPLEDIASSGPGMYSISGVESGEMELKFAVSYVDMHPRVCVSHPLKEDKDESTNRSKDEPTNRGKDEPTNRGKDESTNRGKDKPTNRGKDEPTNKNINDNKDLNNKTIDTNNSKDSGNKPIHTNEIGAFVENEIPQEKGDEEHLPEIHKMNIGIYNTDKPQNNFVSFRTAYKITVKSIADDGSFYMIFETEYLQRKMAPFTTELPLMSSVVIPILNETFIRVRLFRMLINGDVLVGETLHRLGDTVIVFDWIRVEFDVAFCEFRDMEDNGPKDRCKVVQCLVEAPTMEEPALHRGSIFSVELYSGGIMVGQSVVGTLFTFCTGDAPLRGAIRENEKCLISFSFDAASYEQTLDVSSGNPSVPSGIRTKMLVKTQLCDFKLPFCPPRGTLEIFVIRASNIISGNLAHSYVKVYHNAEKVFKTKIKAKDASPVFHESLKIFVEKNKDTLEFCINDSNKVAPNNIICHKEFSLFNLGLGYTRFDLPMVNGTDGSACDTRLQLILNYSASSTIPDYGELN